MSEERQKIIYCAFLARISDNHFRVANSALGKMTLNILVLAFLPLMSMLVATKVYGWAAVTLFGSYLMWNDFHSSVKVPKPLGKRKPSKNAPFPVEAMILLAYLPLAVSLISHNSEFGYKMHKLVSDVSV